MVENTLHCAACQAPLLHWFIRNANSQQTRIRANCPFCSAKSFLTEINGQFAFGPIGKDESKHPTKIINIEYDNDICYFTVDKNE